MFTDEKVAATNDALISQTHYTATHRPPAIHTETRGLFDTRSLYQTTKANRLSAKRLKDDGTVTPYL